MRRRALLMVVAVLLAVPAVQVTDGRSLVDGSCLAPGVEPAAAGAATPLVADLDAVQLRDGSTRGALLETADGIVSGRIPRVTFPSAADREAPGADPVRYLYDEGVALRRVTGVLGYAYAATHDPRYLDTLAAVLHDAATWPDWNDAHPLDTAQVGAAVALAYSWTRDRLAPDQRAAVTEVLVDRLVAPYACGQGPLAARRTSTGNQASVVGTAVVLAGLALRADAPHWAATAVGSGTDALRRAAAADRTGRSVADGPTSEGLMYTSYEAASLALLHATVRTNAELGPT
ncbi:MAG: hypothetical protein ACRDWY_04855, partial [Actinomycetes bacterium]